MGFQFTGRTQCYIEKLTEFTLAVSRRAFGDIRCYRNCRPAHLGCHAELLILRKPLAYLIDVLSQIYGQLPNVQVFMGFHQFPEVPKFT